MLPVRRWKELRNRKTNRRRGGMLEILEAGAEFMIWNGVARVDLFEKVTSELRPEKVF